MTPQEDKAEAFRALHEGDPFVIPNPWDAGTAKVFEGIGFKALATTSGGFAFSLGRADGGVTLEEVVAHVRSLDAASGLPISVDIENGYGPKPEDAAAAIAAVAAAGAVGGSIEDWDPDEERIYEFDHAVERIAAAAAEARSLGFPFTLTARAENHFRGNPDIDDTIARLRAFEEAGADVLYAPRLKDAAELKAVCDAVTAPVNALASSKQTVAELTEAGAQRISVGAWLTFTAVSALVESAEAIMEHGDFSSFAYPPKLGDWLAD